MDAASHLPLEALKRLPQSTSGEDDSMIVESIETDDCEGAEVQFHAYK